MKPFRFHRVSPLPRLTSYPNIIEETITLTLGAFGLSEKAPLLGVRRCHHELRFCLRYKQTTAQSNSSMNKVNRRSGSSGLGKEVIIIRQSGCILPLSIYHHLEVQSAVLSRKCASGRTRMHVTALPSRESGAGNLPRNRC